MYRLVRLTGAFQNQCILILGNLIKKISNYAYMLGPLNLHRANKLSESGNSN